MGETENLAQMPEKIAKEVFSNFGWKEVGPRNHDWNCVHSTGHVVTDEEETAADTPASPAKNTEKKPETEEAVAPAKITHPSDLVMFYDDPYQGDRMYFNFDLKSYGKDSINKNALRKAIENLAYSTECANVSSGWADLYAKDVNNRKTSGLLFVYNHDNAYDPDKFDALLKKIDPLDFRMAKGNRIYVLGPRQVTYLNTISHDIGFWRGQEDETFGGKVIPEASECSFYYPDLITVHPQAHNHPAATIEMLLSPWQILKFSKRAAKVKTIYYFYYSGPGKSTDEFKYLIDFFFRYQLLDDDVEISIRMSFAHEAASTNLDHAKMAYAEHFYNLKEFKARLDRIKFHEISNVLTKFSTRNIGMERRKA